MPTGQQSLTADLLVLATIVGLLVRQLRDRRLRVGMLWLLPVLIAYGSYTLIARTFTPSIISIAVLGVGLALGSAIGLVRGAMVPMVIDRAHASVILKGAPVAVLLWIALIALKVVASALLRGSGQAAEADVATAALVLTSAGSVIANRAYLLWRYAATPA